MMNNSAVRITIIFGVIGLSWIFFSDMIVGMFYTDIEKSQMAQTIKGMSYVTVTSFILYFLINNSQKKLSSSIDHYRNLFQNNPNPMYIYSLQNLRVLEVNEAALRKYGFTRDEFIGISIKDIRPSSERKKLIENIAESKALNQSFETSGPWVHIDKNGKEMLVIISSTLAGFYGKQGRLVMVRDVTEENQSKEKLKESETRMEEVLNTVTDVIWSNDFGKAKVAYVNQAAAKLYEVPLEDIANNPDHWKDFVIEKDQEILNKGIETFQQQGFAEIEYRIKTGEGKVKWLNNRCWFTRNEAGLPVSLRGVIRDITIRKKEQEERKKLIKQLTDFSFATAHSVRRPLSNILGMGEVMRHKKERALSVDEEMELMLTSVKELDQELHNMMEMIKSKGDRLS